MSSNADPLDFVSINVRILGYWGIWPRTMKSKFWTILYWCKGIVYFWLEFVFVSGQIYNAFSLNGDIIGISDTLTMMLTTVSFFVKAVGLVIRRKKLQNLMDMVQCEDFRPKSEEHERILKNWIATARKTTMMFFIVSIITSLSVEIHPLIDGGRRHPSPANYPFVDIKASPIFEMVYILQVCGISSLATTNSMLDTLIPGFMAQAIAQLEMVNASLKNVIELSDEKVEDEAQMKIRDDKAIENMKDVVHHHRMTLKYVDNLEDIFDIMIMFQYLISGIVICCTGIQLVIIDAKDQAFKVVATITFLTTMLTEIFLLCWYGNEIMTKSEGLINTIYYTNWFDKSPKFKNMMRFFMLKVNQPIIMTLGKLVRLNLASFLSILNTSYSYYALLRHMYNSKISAESTDSESQQ